MLTQTPFNAWPSHQSSVASSEEIAAYLSAFSDAVQVRIFSSHISAQSLPVAQGVRRAEVALEFSDDVASLGSVSECGGSRVEPSDRIILLFRHGSSSIASSFIEDKEELIPVGKRS